MGLGSNNTTIFLDTQIFGAYSEHAIRVTLQCKRDVKGGPDPKCDENKGADPAYEFDSRSTSAPYRNKFHLEPKMYLENLTKGDKDFYFEVFVEPSVQDGGAIYYARGMYRTANITCNSRRCYFNEKRQPKEES